MSIKETSFSEADADFDLSKLTPEQRQAFEIAQRTGNKNFKTDKEASRVMGAEEVRAAYKIEITFGPKRTPQGPNNVCIQMWESGKRFDGGGDDRMFWCRDVEQNSQLGCGKPIPSSAIHAGVAICPNCQRAIRADRLTGEQFHRITTQNLAYKVEQLFHDLKDNADVYCKYHQSDIRYQAVLREKGFEKARWLKGLFIYPLKNILKDTSSGATLAARFKAFLSA